VLAAVLLFFACAESDNATQAAPTDWEAWDARALDASTGDVQNVSTPGAQDQWTYGGVFDGGGYQRGRWVTHPPQEFVVDLLGRDFFEQCVRKMKHKREPATICVVNMPPCRQIRVTRDGGVEYEIDATQCGLDVPPEDVRERLRWKYVQ